MKPWAFVLLFSLLGALLGVDCMATLAILDLRFEIQLRERDVQAAKDDRDFVRRQYQECFSRCGP